MIYYSTKNKWGGYASYKFLSIRIKYDNLFNPVSIRGRRPHNYI
jgi:hypothetical protein